MQEGFPDWNEICEPETRGCCLTCDDAEDGCLCFSCKCTKCYRYSLPFESDVGRGSCDLVAKMRNEKIKRKEKIELDANKIKAKNLVANPLIEQQIIDLLKANPDSKNVFATLGTDYPEEEINIAFNSIILNGLVNEKLTKHWDGKGFVYDGEIGYWKVIK